MKQLLLIWLMVIKQHRGNLIMVVLLKNNSFNSLWHNKMSIRPEIKKIVQQHPLLNPLIDFETVKKDHSVIFISLYKWFDTTA
jgi:hypothetical protein